MYLAVGYAWSQHDTIMQMSIMSFTGKIQELRTIYKKRSILLNFWFRSPWALCLPIHKDVALTKIPIPPKKLVSNTFYIENLSNKKAWNLSKKAWIRQLPELDASICIQIKHTLASGFLVLFLPLIWMSLEVFWIIKNK